jgi:hypothetical protein
VHGRPGGRPWDHRGCGLGSLGGDRGKTLVYVSAVIAEFAVAERLLHHLHGHVSRERQGRGTVPEVVQPNWRQLGRLDERVKS